VPTAWPDMGSHRRRSVLFGRGTDRLAAFADPFHRRIAIRGREGRRWYAGGRRCAGNPGYAYRLAPLTTKSTSPTPHAEQRSRAAQSRSGVASPWRAACSAGSSSALWPHALHQTTRHTLARAELPSVAGPDSPFDRPRAISSDTFCRNELTRCKPTDSTPYHRRSLIPDGGGPAFANAFG
jgi:hypothetical protein